MVGEEFGEIVTAKRNVLCLSESGRIVRVSSGYES